MPPRSAASATGRVCSVPSYKARAVVLKKTKLKEKDLILTMLSDTGEQIRAVAKGAQKPGGSFAARLEVFSVVDLMLYTGKSLDTITDARTVETNEACRSDITRLSYGAVMAELVEKTALEGQEMPVAFPLTCTALGSLGRVGEETLPFVASAFLIKLLAYQGFKPSFDDCTHCGRVRADDSAGSGIFSISAGGWVCGECAQASGLAPDEMLSDQVVSWARSLMSMRFSQIEELFVQGAVEGEAAIDGGPAGTTAALGALGGGLLSFCERWIGVHLGLRMKTMSYLSRLHI